MAKKKPSKTATANSKILASVPANAIFVNKTTLDTKILKAVGAMGTNSVLRLFYMLCGVLIGIGAVVCRFALGTSTMTTVLVLVLGLMIVWQGTRLPLENARRMALAIERESKRTGQDARERVCFATATSFGCVLADGKIRTWDWNQFDTFKGNMQVMALGLKEKGSPAFAIDMTGFIKGRPGDFLSFVHTHIHEKKLSKLEKTADKICFTLDNWTKIQQADKAAKDAEKAEKKAAKAAKKAAKSKKGDK